MMGIQHNCPVFIYGDNQSVLSNTTIPHSMLKKKSNYIAYHFVREVTARKKWRATYIKTNYNRSNILTKQFPYGEKEQSSTRCYCNTYEFGDQQGRINTRGIRTLLSVVEKEGRSNPHGI